MLKRLLVAAFALSFLFAMCNLAFAAKDQNQIKRLINHLPTAPRADGELIRAGTPAPEIVDKPEAVLTPEMYPSPLPRVADCDTYDYFCGVRWYYRSGFDVDYLNQRFTAETAACTLVTVEMWFYNNYALFSDASGMGVDIVVWDDDGFGLPGTEVARINVPAASMIYYPDSLYVNLRPLGLVFGGDFHVGSHVVDWTDDIGQAMSDDGSCGVNRSSGYYITNSLFYGLLDLYGEDRNFLIRTELCCVEDAPTECHTLDYTCGVYWLWAIPYHGSDIFGQRFTPHADLGDCQVITLKICMYAPWCTDNTGLGIDLNLWDDDGFGYPGTIIHTTTVPGPSVVYYPDTVRVDVTAENLYFSDDYYIGFNNVDPVNDSWATLSDDGSCGTRRGIEYWAGAWWYMIDDWALDVNMLVFAEECCPEDPNASQCYTLDYAGSPYYYWTIPDIFNDHFFNMRFTPGIACTLETLNIAFYEDGSSGNPGANLFLWETDGEFPTTTVIYTIAIEPVTKWYPAFEDVDVSMLEIVPFGDFHFGYDLIDDGMGEADILACMSDDGSNPYGRSSEEWNGTWRAMASSWGIDVNFLMNIDVCCAPEGYCWAPCDPDDQWPTYAHDFQRTSRSGLEFGDLCSLTRKWIYTSPSGSWCDWSNPAIGDDLVFVSFSNAFHAVNLLTGAPVWNTETHGDYAGYPPFSSNRGTPTLDLDNGLVYFTVGTFSGMICAEMATGNIVWERNAVLNPLPGAPGNTRFAPAVILGEEIYFGCEGKQLYALDRFTGATIDYLTLPHKMYTSLSLGKGGVDSADVLFVGTSAGYTGGGGGIDCYAPPNGGSFSLLWTYTPPQATAGYTVPAVFRCDNLFIQSEIPFGDADPWTGARQNLDPYTGTEIWSGQFGSGSGRYGGMAVDGERLYMPGYIGTSAGAINGQGVRGVNFANSTEWTNGGWGFGVPSHTSSTCDPYAIFGTYNFDATGNWNIVDGVTGEILISYLFAPPGDYGIMFGTAIARGSDGHYYAVVGNYSDYGYFCFSDMDDRARMVIPEHVVYLDPVSTSDPTISQRTDEDAILNTGCLTLTVHAALEAGLPPLSKHSISSVNPLLYNSAENLANRMVDRDVEKIANKLYAKVFNTQDELPFSILPVKPAKANSSVLAPPTWVTFNHDGGGSVIDFSIIADDSKDFEFNLDQAGMTLLADNYFYVDIGPTNDPDYVLQSIPQPALQDYIEYHVIYAYCPDVSGVMNFGDDGEEIYNNRARFGIGDLHFEFTLSGSDDFLYEGTLFFMTNMDNAAWYPFGASNTGIAYLHPFYISGLDCGGCDFGVTLPVEYTTNSGVSYNNTAGDICSFAVIDSLQTAYSAVWPHQVGPPMGILVNYTEIGTYGADFADFKLVVAQISNRNGTPLDDMYYGMFTDWDVASGANNSFADPAKGYIYTFAAGEIYGQLGLPLSCSYWPDGTPTDPMYNARVNHNPTEIYPPADYMPDSLFAWVDDVAEGDVRYATNADPLDPPDDQSYETAFGKVSLAGFGTHKFAFAMFGFANGSDAEVEALSKFVNQYAGFDRGNVNGDDVLDLLDLVYLNNYNATGLNGPVPFMHLGDVTNDGVVDGADCSLLADFFFMGGPPPQSDFVFPL